MNTLTIQEADIEDPWDGTKGPHIFHVQQINSAFEVETLEWVFANDYHEAVRRAVHNATLKRMEQYHKENYEEALDRLLDCIMFLKVVPLFLLERNGWVAEHSQGSLHYSDIEAWGLFTVSKTDSPKQDENGPEHVKILRLCGTE